MDFTTAAGLNFLSARYNATTKSVDVSRAPESDFWYEPIKGEAEHEPQDLYRMVPWLWRGVELRANAVAGMPFRIMRGETEFDLSEDYQNKVGFLPDPAGLLWLVESALTMFGYAYLWRERNRVKSLGLRYVHPESIEPKIDEVQGLTGFVRRVGGRQIEATTQDVVWFWRPDPYVEIGPPEGSPATAALGAAGVLYNVDQFAAAFFKRGAIKATLLTVEGPVQAQERDRLKTWWARMVSGIRNAFATEILNAKVQPIIIGEGLSELSDNQLAIDKRQDIATALGVPQSVIFSDSASGLGGGGVAAQDDQHFYDKTIRGECRLIESVLNPQVFEPLGLRFDFMIDSLDVFQEDETQRAQAFASYVSSGLPRSLVAEMLGLDLPPGWEYERLDEIAEERRQEMAELMQGRPQDDDQDDRQPPNQSPPNGDAKAILGDLYAWRRKSKKRGHLAEFESDIIPVVVMDELKAHDDNGWRDALDGVIAVYEGEEDAEDEHDAFTTAELDAMQKVASEYAKAAEMLAEVLKGGPGSGNFGHAGRPGKRGGSSPGGGGGGGGGSDSTSAKPKERRRGRVLSSDDDVEAVGKQMAGNLIGKLSGMEGPAIEAYTGDEHYTAINSALRGGNALSGKNKMIANNMDSALKKATVPEDLVLFRGLSDASSFGFKVGDSFTDNGFPSASLSQSVGETFAPRGKGALLRINVAKGQNGAYMDGLSKYPEEHEVVLPRGSKFRVVAVTKDNAGRTLVDVDLE